MSNFDKESVLLHGPEKNRSCTDVICCLLFTAFMVSMIVIGFVGFATGDPDLLIYPYDSSGNQCGRPGTDTSDFDYLYYVTPLESFDYRICLKACPAENSEVIEGFGNSWITINPGKTSFAITGGDQTVATIGSTDFLTRFCLPKIDITTSDSEYAEIIDQLTADGATEWATDIALSWSAIMAVFAISIFVSIIFVVVLRYCVSCVLWSVIFLTVILLILSGYYMFTVADQEYSEPEDEGTYNALKIGSFVIWGLTLIFIIVVLVMCNRIRLAVAIMKAAASFLNDVKSTIFIPIIMFFAFLVFMIYWVLALVYVYTSGTLVVSDKASTFAEVEWTDSTRNAFFFELVGILWVNCFKIAIVQFCIAYCVCYWYFSPDKDDMSSPVGKAFRVALRYHLGSLAFGSLIIAIIKLIKWFFHFLKSKVYKEGASNFATKCLCGCVSALIWCFEKCMEFLDKHAYIHIAMTGESFCKSAKESFLMIFENAARFAVMGSIGDIFTFLGNIFITVVSSYCGYIMITQWDYIADQIENPLPPTIVFILVSYIVSSLFLNVYDMACDSIIHAYLIDEKNNTLEYNYAPESLKDFIKEHRDN